MAGGGGDKNISLKPPRLAATAEIKIFMSNFWEMYYKLNKLEHFSKCLYKIRKNLYFFFENIGRGGAENYSLRSSTSDKYKYF